ncbi:hypothetical protein [Amycolatopsis sp. FDAARGOS 1241]|uniref:hypothetical protein n=1 Tax=Amycolatopsis sp. FDAARGOS 1241 TaxID=2778070 RepID=UPI00351C06BA
MFFTAEIRIIASSSAHPATSHGSAPRPPATTSSTTAAATSSGAPRNVSRNQPLTIAMLICRIAVTNV